MCLLYNNDCMYHAINDIANVLKNVLFNYLTISQMEILQKE